MIDGMAPRRTAILSIHDVMPETFARVLDIVRFIEARGADRFTLLVVPGKRWSAAQIGQIKALQDRGVDLAGHGWQHRIYRRTTSIHRLHGRIISRDSAEHLSLTQYEVAEIIARCYRWFGDVGLAPPQLYVPPAWAMGNMPWQCRQKLPFQLYETQFGLYDCHRSTLCILGVTGYMADTQFRRVALRGLNRANMALFRGPLRIAIHPDDLRLPLVGDLSRHLRQCGPYVGYTDILSEARISHRKSHGGYPFRCRRAGSLSLEG
jgi:predicted deacetylase